MRSFKYLYSTSFQILSSFSLSISYTETNHFSMSFSFSYWNITAAYLSVCVSQYDDDKFHEVDMFIHVSEDMEKMTHWKQQISWTMVLGSISLTSMRCLISFCHFSGGPGLAGTRVSPFWILLERGMVGLETWSWTQGRQTWESLQFFFARLAKNLARSRSLGLTSVPLEIGKSSVETYE